MTPGGGKDTACGSGNSDFVVVANRLPIDMERLPDGSTPVEAEPRRPGHRPRAVAAPAQGRLDRLAGHSGQRRRPDRRGRSHAVSGAAVRRGRGEVLRGVLQRHAVAALPRRHRQADLPPRVVGQLRRREPALRRGDLAGGRRGRDGMGAGLSAAAGAEDAADAAARSHHRILSAHSVSAGRAVHADAVADRDHRRVCSAPTWSASTCPAARRTS